MIRGTTPLAAARLEPVIGAVRRNELVDSRGIETEESYSPTIFLAADPAERFLWIPAFRFLQLEIPVVLTSS